MNWIDFYTRLIMLRCVWPADFVGLGFGIELKWHSTLSYCIVLYKKKIHFNCIRREWRREKKREAHSTGELCRYKGREKAERSCKRRFVSEHFTPRRHSWTFACIGTFYQLAAFLFSIFFFLPSYPTPLLSLFSLFLGFSSIYIHVICIDV